MICASSTKRSRRRERRSRWRCCEAARSSTCHFPLTTVQLTASFVSFSRLLLAMPSSRRELSVLEVGSGEWLVVIRVMCVVTFSHAQAQRLTAHCTAIRVRYRGGIFESPSGRRGGLAV